MKVTSKAGKDDLALVYIAEMDTGKFVEFVESVQPPKPRERKWVLIISTLYGCPVGCKHCDAGDDYHGKLTAKEMLAQIDYLVTRRYPDRKLPMENFKIQFARMGEPAFNQAVLEVLETFPELYDAPGFVPSISTVAPHGTDAFFERLLKIKKERYRERFQFQFSIHTTDVEQRNWMIPVKTWDFQRMARYGRRFFDEGGKKITLNFSLADRMVIDPVVLFENFSPDRFLIKLTPVNPTFKARQNDMSSNLDSSRWQETVDKLTALGYDVIHSVGELEESSIGSNCGQFLTRHLNADHALENAYTYDLERP